MERDSDVPQHGGASAVSDEAAPAPQPPAVLVPYSRFQEIQQRRRCPVVEPASPTFGVVLAEE